MKKVNITCPIVLTIVVILLWSCREAQADWVSTPSATFYGGTITRTAGYPPGEADWGYNAASEIIGGFDDDSMVYGADLSFATVQSPVTNGQTAKVQSGMYELGFGYEWEGEGTPTGGITLKHLMQAYDICRSVAFNSSVTANATDTATNRYITAWLQGQTEFEAPLPNYGSLNFSSGGIYDDSTSYTDPNHPDATSSSDMNIMGGISFLQSSLDAEAIGGCITNESYAVSNAYLLYDSDGHYQLGIDAYDGDYTLESTANSSNSDYIYFADAQRSQFDVLNGSAGS